MVALAKIPQSFSSNMATTDISDLPLLNLPPELRNRIYQAVLTENGPVFLRKHGYGRANWRPPALLATCRTIRREASSFYYNTNVFLVNTLGAGNCDDLVIAWLSKLETRNRLQLQKIYLDNKLYFSNEIVSRLEDCSSVLANAGIPVPDGVLYVEIYGERGAGVEERYGGDYPFWINLPQALERQANK